MSPSDRWQDIRSKLDDCFFIGVERVWIVEPNRCKVLVYRLPTDLSAVREGDVLRGEGVLEGFELPVAYLIVDL
ncbi:MAG: Uma2 family endonuclease [Anaerolineae bacterium]|nr:Uma2 family endonuclease [Anaerolineae bacterium]